MMNITDEYEVSHGSDRQVARVRRRTRCRGDGEEGSQIPMGPGGATEVKEGSLNGEGDVDEVDEVDGGEEVVEMTENEP